METLYETLVSPCVQGLDLRRDNKAGKSTGVTFTCDPDLASGFFWIRCQQDDSFAVSVMDICLGQLVGALYDHPELYALNYVERSSSCNAWREGLRASQTHRADPRASAVPSHTGAIGYHQPEGTFCCPLAQGQRVQSMALTFAPKYLSELSRRFRVEREIIERACFDLSRTRAVPAADIALRQLFRADPAPCAADMYYEGKMLEVVSLLLRSHLSAAADNAAKHTEQDDACIDRVVTYIHQHACQPITLDALERIATMGRTKLSAMFKDRTGMSPIAYLRCERVKAASILLASTEQPIESIAHAIGYENPGAFAERFKKEVGLTPTEFRIGEHSAARPHADS